MFPWVIFQAAAFRTEALSKKDSNIILFLWMLQYVKEHLFWRTFAKKSVDPLTVTKEKNDVDDSYLVQSFYSRKVAETINKKK